MRKSDVIGLFLALMPPPWLVILLLLVFSSAVADEPEDPPYVSPEGIPVVSLYEKGEIRPGHGKYLTGEGGWVVPLQVSFQSWKDRTEILVEAMSGENGFCAVDPEGVPGVLYVVKVEGGDLLIKFLAVGLSGGSTCPDGTYFRMTKTEFHTMVFGE